MKSQTTLLLIVLVLGFSSCSTVNWDAIWKLHEPYKGECYPESEIVILQRDTDLQIQSYRPADKGCKVAFGEIYTVPFPERNTVDLGYEESPTHFKRRLLLQGDKLTLLNQDGTQVTYKRTFLEYPPQWTQWVGDWTVDRNGLNPLKCYPKGDIIIVDTGSALKFSWTWESSEGCKALELDGKTFTNSFIIRENTTKVNLKYYVKGVLLVADFFMDDGRIIFLNYFENTRFTVSKKTSSFKRLIK